MTEYWRKTPSPDNKGACVEIGRLTYGDYAIRNSLFRADRIPFTREQLLLFIRAVKLGVFDDFVEGPR